MWVGREFYAMVETRLRDTERRAFDATMLLSAFRTKVANLEAENRELRAALADAKAAHRVTTAHFEWLQVMFNRESAERSLLAAQRLNVNLAPMTVGRQPVAGAATVDARMGVGDGYDASASFAEPLPGQEPAPVIGREHDDEDDGKDLANLEAEVGHGMFEDPGDDKAAEYGANHDATGSVAYAR